MKTCPKCGNPMYANGLTKLKTGAVRYYRCTECNFKSKEHAGSKLPRGRKPKLVANNKDKCKEYMQQDGSNLYTQYLVDRVPRTLAESEELHNVDKSIWQAKKFIASAWGSDKNPMHMLKVWWEPRNSIDENMAAEFFQEVAKEAYRLPKSKLTRPQESNNILEISIADLHLGKLSEVEETGELCNLEVSQSNFSSLLDDQIRKSFAYAYDKILFIVGNDFFHTDSIYNTTTKGTSLDTDGKWWKHYKIGTKLLTGAVEKLRQIAPVEVIIIPGNHDRQRMYYAGLHLDAYFKDCEDVKVDARIMKNKFYRHGNVLIGYSHKCGKDQDLFAEMAYHPAWETVIHKEWHLAHLHREMTKDYKGMIIRRQKAASPISSWDKDHFFCHTLKGADGYVYNNNDGLLGYFPSYLHIVREDAEVSQPQYSW